MTAPLRVIESITAAGILHTQTAAIGANWVQLGNLIAPTDNLNNAILAAKRVDLENIEIGAVLLEWAYGDPDGLLGVTQNGATGHIPAGTLKPIPVKSTWKEIYLRRSDLNNSPITVRGIVLA